ncbi:MAG TPA: oligoribonuclease [Polyangiaceae bacterium]
MSEPVRRVQAPVNLAWIDLEMTGLDSGRDVILQAALVITNSVLHPLEEFSCDVWQPAAALESMVPAVREMHEKSGLLGRVARSSIDLRAAEGSLLERISGWCPYPAVIAGNSIAQDRRFIDRHLPGLAGYLHYRMLDVSTVKLLARLWYGESAVYVKSKAQEHDALVDIKNSIRELAHYRATLFRP